MSATPLIVAKTTLLSRDNLALQLVLVATLAVTENRYMGSRWSHCLNLMQLVTMDSLEVAEDRYMGWLWSNLLDLVQRVLVRQT